MAIDSGTTLQTTGPAAAFARAYLLGVESSLGKIKDLVNNVEKAITLNGGMTRGSDADGDALICATEATDYASLAEDLDPTGTAMSVALVFKPSTTTISDWRALFAMFNASGPLVHMGKFDGTGDFYWSNQGSLLQFTALSNLAANTVTTIAVTWDGTNAKLFMPNVASLSHSWTEGAHPQTSGAATALRIANSSSGDGGFRGRYYFWGYANTAWSDTDAQAVADDIEGTLFASGSPTAYTLTAAAGGFTMTGKAATLKNARKLVAVQGAFTHTGKAAALNKGFRMGAVKGDFALTGQSSSLSRTRKLVAAKGDLTLAGKAANLNKGFRMAATAGAVTLTGHDLAFKRTYAMAAAAGGFNLTGIAAGFKRALALSAAPGAFTLTGQDATLTQGGAGAFVLSAGAGSFVLSGKDAVLQAARKLALTSGTFALTGNAAALARGLKLLAEAGVFTVEGQDAVMKVTRGLSAGPAVFTLTGQDIRFIAGEQFNFPDTEVVVAPWVQRTIIVALEPRIVYAQPRNTPFVTDEDRTIIAPNRRSP